MEIDSKSVTKFGMMIRRDFLRKFFLTRLKGGCPDKAFTALQGPRLEQLVWKGGDQTNFFYFITWAVCYSFIFG
jgi:hypothetical protein